MASKKNGNRFDSSFISALLFEAGVEKAPTWFQQVSFGTREDFCLQYASKRWNVCPNGNPSSIVVSYPRPDGRIRMYDIDSGELFWVLQRELTPGKVTGRACQEDYGYNAVMMDYTVCESEDIRDIIRWDLVKELDNGDVFAFVRCYSKDLLKVTKLPKKPVNHK